jgi:hypothetical protein
MNKLIEFDVAAFDRNEQEALQRYGEFYRRFCKNPLSPTPDERDALNSYCARRHLDHKATARAEELIKQRIVQIKELQEQDQCSTTPTAEKLNSLIQRLAVMKLAIYG